MNAVHAFLVDAYWARGIPLETVRRSIEHSIPFGVLLGDHSGERKQRQDGHNHGYQDSSLHLRLSFSIGEN